MISLPFIVILLDLNNKFIWSLVYPSPLNTILSDKLSEDPLQESNFASHSKSFNSLYNNNNNNSVTELSLKLNKKEYDEIE